MSNRTAAAWRKPSQAPPGDYSHCACSRLHPCCLAGREQGGGQGKAARLVAVGRFSNPQPIPQTEMSCATCAVFGSRLPSEA